MKVRQGSKSKNGTSVQGKEYLIALGGYQRLLEAHEERVPRVARIQ